MKHKKLSRKALYALLVFSILMIAATSISVITQYRRNFLSRTRDAAVGYNRMVAEIIDGDKVLSYLQTGQTDADYDAVQNLINNLQENTEIKYCYVIVPLEDTVAYVWDANATEEGNLLGNEDTYMENGKQLLADETGSDPAEKLILNDDEEYGELATLFSAVYNSAGEAVCFVGVDIALPGLLQAQRQFAIIVVLNIFCCMLLLSIAFYWYIRRRIVQPIEFLDAAAGKMAEKLETEDSIEIDIHTNDEIEDLADSFKTMFSEVRAYMLRLEKMTAEKERISTELNVATEIQEDMLPTISPAFPNRTDFDIYASMDPAKEVGGDFYDFFLIDHDHLALVMADVSGKGVPAALFMVISKELLNQRSRMGGTPAEILGDVNKQLCENNKAEMFVTCWIGILDLKTGKLTAASAGHEYPVLKRVDGPFELLKDRHGFVLAGMDMARYHNYELELHPGDKLFLYTDGVAEATNADNELFGTDRMVNALNIDRNADCKEVLRLVRGQVDAFVKDAPQFDDLTMLCFEYIGSDAQKGKE